MIRFFAFTNCWDRIRDPWSLGPRLGRTFFENPFVAHYFFPAVPPRGQRKLLWNLLDVFVLGVYLWRVRRAPANSFSQAHPLLEKSLLDNAVWLFADLVAFGSCLGMSRFLGVINYLRFQPLSAFARFVLDSILVPLTIFDTWAPQPNKLGPKNPEIGFWNARSTLCRCQGQGWAEFDRTEPYQCPSVRSNLDAVLLSGQYPPTLTSTNVLNGLIESSYSLQHEKDSASVRLLS